MAEAVATGWDLGGAHLKVAQADSTGRLVVARQLPCPLWRGLGELTAAMSAALEELAPTARHGLTMTGELVDLFAGREEGVERLTQAMSAALPAIDLRLYGGDVGFVAAAHAVAHARDIASANWHASARFVAGRCRAGLFVDVGSTTSDFVPFADGETRASGYTDHERLIAEELVYSGVTRTPAMGLAETVPFEGQRSRLMAEYFATAADIHRLTGRLPEDADQHPTADGRGKTAVDSARRLARMIGRDLESATLQSWQRLATSLAECQLRLLQDAAERVLSGARINDDAPIVGAGIGRFLARDLAERLRRPYVDFADIVEGPPAVREWAARCAPAAAVATLAAGW